MGSVVAKGVVVEQVRAPSAWKQNTNCTNYTKYNPV